MDFIAISKSIALMNLPAVAAKQRGIRCTCAGWFSPSRFQFRFLISFARHSLSLLLFLAPPEQTQAFGLASMF